MTRASWTDPVGGDFNTMGDWTTDAVPGADDDAILAGLGPVGYTVTASTSESVNSIQTASIARLVIDGGVFLVASGTGDGVNAGAILVEHGAALEVSGSIVNVGIITLGSKAGAGSMIIGAPGATDVTLSGGGQIILNAKSDLYASNAVPFGLVKLTNIDNTISGAGFLGADALTLVNREGGVIDADGAAAMTIEGTIINRGLVESTGSGGLVLADATIDDSMGGVIDPGSKITLQLSSILGGELTLAAGAVLTAVGSANYLSTSTLTNHGVIDVASGARLQISGTIDNTGKIALQAAGGHGADVTLLTIGPGVVTLTGGGAVTLSDRTRNFLNGVAGSTLINVDNRISGAGEIGHRKPTFTLINQAAGVIDANGDRALIIDTAASTIQNAGLIEASGAGGATIRSKVDNEGVLAADGGNLTLRGAVSGAGSALINGGTLYFASRFNQAVGFTGASGVLELAKSSDFHGAITGFSPTGGTSFDLDDIGFVGPGEATYVDDDSHQGGVLTVTDGAHRAHIRLVGDYSASTFTASSDGHGGVVVVGGPQTSAPHHLFIAAMAGIGVRASASAHLLNEWDHPRPIMIAAPRLAIA